MQEEILKLIQLRQVREDAKNAKTAMIEQVKEQSTYQALCIQEAEVTGMIADLEEMIREEARQAYVKDPANKKPAPGIGIRITQDPVYEYDQARKWAEQHLPEAIVLDTKLFTQHAKAVLKTAPIPVVSWKEEVQVTISPDLQKYYQPDDLEIPAEVEAV